MDEERKVAIITGASRGIGEALVKAYRGRNYRVIANARSIEPSSDPDILAVAGDIGDARTAEQIISQAIDRFGRVDTLVNNAGIFIGKPFIEYTNDDYAKMLAINLNGFFHITRRTAAEMLRRESGHIVQITSSLDENVSSAAPSALAALTKGGLNAATKSLAVEFASRGIRVNAVAPGATKTSMHRPEMYDHLAKQHPIGRMGEVHEIVEAVLFLEGAGFVTGEILHVDGGQSAGS
ncbi:SDR family NAD(P)-dependent oxidoreductase [Bradyrhizobium sp. CCBAU 53338]|uniref:SDR family NAD(P)-dependent oxidoreductase n=1 Tax=Bradyrhizobium sp. CCBAU 53338 TaxID=1325111 RepID=UPI00188BCB8C|nr:SDR family oxidoreductase [Bradyrhizobium sp. CCBAU 53338]QOZ56073.1 3-oxoacyl-ACP reductase [Bradyrhizobium sp. CCBAU 53338]